MNIAHALVVGTRFLVEIAGVGAIVAWSWTLPASPAAKLVASAIAAVTVIALWGWLLAPHSAVAIPAPLKVSLQLLVLTAAVAALLAAGHRGTAAVFGTVAYLDAVLLMVWNIGQ